MLNTRCRDLPARNDAYSRFGLDVFMRLTPGFMSADASRDLPKRPGVTPPSPVAALRWNAPRHALHQDQRKRAEYQPLPDPDSSLARRKISLTKLSPVPAPSRFRRHHNRAKLEIPIDHRRSPAGSCMGGFRTPAPCPDARPEMAGVRKPSPSKPKMRRNSLLQSRHRRKVSLIVTRTDNDVHALIIRAD